MLPWINFAVLVASSVLFCVFYVKSVGPAALEKKIGPTAYKRCATYRLVASILMFVTATNYILSRWFVLPLPLPRALPWPWWVSAVIAALIAVPSAYLMRRGAKDAGEETMRPKREHTLYGGIYTKIRHPQALGELPLWWVLAFLMHSPFLVLLSFAYIPVWYYFCVAEERDLVIRYGAPYEHYRRKTGFWLPKTTNNESGGGEEGSK
jgi:protein-S-isoprenylcysteine O-methyltransferase Ste14